MAFASTISGMGSGKAASWMLNKYRAYRKKKKAEAAAKRKAAAEKGADTYQPPPVTKEKKKPKKKKETYGEAGKRIKGTMKRYHERFNQ
jgi:hypothetical protein